MKKDDDTSTNLQNALERLRIKPVQLIPLSFLLVIAFGTLLLMMPIATSAEEPAGFLTALFTATTSICVTGLVVVDTFSYWSLFGQLVILILIQVGGLGVVAVGSMFMLLGKKKFFLRNRMLLGDSLNLDARRGQLQFLIRMFRGVFIVEACGAILCAVKLVPMLGVGQGLWASLFQSVSAFCNAGMDVIGPDSMISLRTSNLLMWTTMILIILGGLGFVVWFDLSDGIRTGIRQHFSPAKIFRRLPEHTKVVLIVTATLILGGAAIVFGAEYANPSTIGGMGLKDKILNCLFQSVTFRTAGFASIPQENLTEISCMTGYVLMFIGGSPVGTAGGIKTVTAFLFFINAFSYVNGKKENVIFHKRVPEEVMKKSAAIVFVSLVTVFVITLLIMGVEGISQTDALYEVTSALGTVGLSRAITPTLHRTGRIIITVAMFLGRVGPISMALFFAKGTGADNTFRHADGKFYVG